MLKKIFSFLLIVLIVCGGIFAYFKFFGNKTAIIEVKKLDEISGYNYILQDNDTEIFKKYFNELDKVLTEKEINYEEYAKNIASLFIIDLYTINNKVNKYDIGGADYIEPTVKDNYMLKVSDTIYRYVSDNTTGERKQALPEVNNVNIESITKTDYKLGDTKYEAYKVTLTWTYKEDLGYDKTGSVTLIKNDKFLYVVEKE